MAGDGPPTAPGVEPATRAQLRTVRRLGLRKERERSRQFLAEGPRTVREALNQPGAVRELLLTSSAAAAHPGILAAARAAGMPVATLTEDDLASLTDTVHPQGVVAVCRTQPGDLAEVLDRRPRLLACGAAIRDPGNAGTLIRSADAFGADAVIVTRDSVEVTNPKTVRASVGSVFHLPLITEVDGAEVVAGARAAGLQVLAADGRGEVDLLQLGATGGLAAPTLWVFGNEARGLPAADRVLADRVVRVPIFGAAESLNLAAAAAVCLFASATAQRAS